MAGFVPGGSSSSSIDISIEQNVKSKINRIQGAANYTRTLTYVGATEDVATITHVGTTDLGVETIVETITRDGSNRITGIVYT